MVVALSTKIEPQSAIQIQDILQQSDKENQIHPFVEVSLDDNDKFQDKNKNEASNERVVSVSVSVTPEVSIKTLRTGWSQYLGIIFAVFSGLFLSLVLLLVKVLSAYHPLSLSFWRQLGNVIPSIPLVLYFRYYKKEKILDTVWPLKMNDNWQNVCGLTVRGFLGATAVILRFHSLEYLTIADSTVVTYSGPIFIVILAHFFLKEKCGVISIGTGIWTLLGVILICRPPFITGAPMDTKILIGTGIALGVVVCQSTVTVLMRKMRKIHFAVMTLSFGICGLLESSIAAFSAGVFSVPQGYRDIGLTMLLAILSFLGQMSVILALKFEQAGPVSLVRTCDVFYAFIWQMVFLNVYPDEYSILGATIVVFGVLLTCFRKWISTLPEEDFKRKTFKCLLRLGTLGWFHHKKVVQQVKGYDKSKI